ncbi:MAG: hypothetical protein IJD02_04815 [Lachnospiraceae bacterium]|nr:hypothetical protein [Lachnospiraceae bacterium]
MSNKHLRFFLSSILAFVLGILLTCLTYIGDLYFRGLNSSVLVSAITKTNYSVELIDAMYAECESVTLPIGLPIEVVHGIFDLEDVKRDVSASVKASVEEKEFNADTTLIREKLLDNINAYLQEENLQLSDEQNEYLEEYLLLIEDIYNDNIEMVIISRAMPYWNSFLDVALVAFIGIIILSIIIIVAIVKMHSWRHRALRYITYSTISTFLMSVILPIVLYVSHFYEKLSISPKYFYMAMIYMIDEFLIFSIRMGCFWALISAILIGAIYVCKKNGYKRSCKGKGKVRR